jgi:hypothetical protein
MRLKRTLATSALMAAISLATLAVAAETGKPAAEDDYSVARFLVDLARFLDPDLPAETSVDEAAAGLSRMGVTPPEDTDLQAPVTEADVVRLAGLLGVRIRSLDPGKPFPPWQVEPLGILLREALGAGKGSNQEKSGSPPGKGD